MDNNEEYKKFDIVICHSNCHDGNICAWIVKKFNPNIKILYCKNNEVPIIKFDTLKSKKIIIVDMCPHINFVLTLLHLCEKVCIIDHHITTISIIDQIKNEELKKNLMTLIYCDNTECGCTLTWQYFYGNSNYPWYFKYIKDKDLSLSNELYSKEINSALYDDNLITIEKLDNFNSIPYDIIFPKLLENGKIIERYKNKIIDTYIKNATPCTFIHKNKTYYLWLYECKYCFLYDISSKLLNIPIKVKNTNFLPDFIVNLAYDLHNNEYNVSFRSLNDRQDVKTISEIFNGNGNKFYSNCKIDGNVELNKIFVPV